MSKYVHLNNLGETFELGGKLFIPLNNKIKQAVDFFSIVESLSEMLSEVSDKNLDELFFRVSVSEIVTGVDIEVGTLHEFSEDAVKIAQERGLHSLFVGGSESELPNITKELINKIIKNGFN